MRLLAVLPACLLSLPAAAAALDGAALDDALAAADRDAHVCLSDAAKGGEVPGGELVFRAVVAPDGRIAEVKVLRTTMQSADLIDCVTGAIKRQQIARPDGGGFMPVTRAFVLWDPPPGEKPVRVQAARRVAADALPDLTACLDARPDRPDKLAIDLLVAKRTVHPVTGALPAEWARCVSSAFHGSRVGGVGSVQIHLAWNDEGEGRVERVQSRSADGGEQHDLEADDGKTASAGEPEQTAAVAR